MKIGIATDHNGVEQKQDIIKYLEEKGYEVVDYSPSNTSTDDYPDYAVLVSEGVLAHNVDFGVLMCGTGIGMSIAANKIKGIRAAKVTNEDEARLAREHNDANIICLSYRDDMNRDKELINIFVNTSPDPDERHARRIRKIGEIERDEY